MIVIGSMALKSHAITQGRPFREPADWDVVGSFAELQTISKSARSCMPVEGGKKFLLNVGNKKMEFEISWPGSAAELLVELCEDVKPKDFPVLGVEIVVAPLTLLYTLKMTHRFKKGSHFLKTRSDIMFMREMGISIPSDHDTQEFFRLRQNEALNYEHPKLNRSKSEFFSPVVDYVYDHDSVHWAIRRGPQPAYEYFKPPGNEVLTSRSMFEDLPYDIQLNAVIEESTVLALERSQIPHRGKITPMDSFKIALEKVCTSITSGWFRTFAWENYDAALAAADPQYAEKFFRLSSTVRKHRPTLSEGTGLATDHQVAGGLG